MRARRWLVAAIAITATLAAFGASMSQPDRYRASADLLFGRTNAVDTILAGGASDSGSVPEREAATNLALASLETVAARVREQFRGPATVQDIRDAVEVQAKGDSDLVTVTAEWGGPREAAAVANAFATQIIELRRETAQAEIQRAIDALNSRIRTAQEGATAGAAGATPSNNQQIRSLQSRVSELEVLRAVQTGDVRIVQRAAPPPERSSPMPVRDAFVGGSVGVVLALLVVVLLVRLDPRVRDEDQLMALLDAPVLARIPQAADSRRLRHSSGVTRDPAFLEAFQFLRLNLQLMTPAPARSDADRQALEGPGNGANGVSSPPNLDRSLIVEVEGGFTHPALGGAVRKTRGSVQQALNRMAKNPTATPGRPRAAGPPVIAVTSPGDGDGKTTVVGWLAHSLAANGAEVVAVDLDLRNPALHEAFDLPRGPDGGVLTALLESANGSGLAQATQYPRLRVLPGAERPVVGSGMIGHGRLRRTFNQLRRGADYVLVDSSPVSTVADASAVAAVADGVILVVDLQRARRKELLVAKQQLTHARATLLGIVLNRSTDELPAHHYAHQRRPAIVPASHAS